MALAKYRGPIGLSLLLIIILSLSIIGVVFTTDGSKEYDDVFVHQDIHIDANQAIGRLMVAGGNATVRGKVMEDIVVVDGNLTVEPGATVNGKAIVLGGDTSVEQGAIVRQKPWVIAPQGHPLVPVIIGAFFLLGSASLILVPTLCWISGYLFKKTSWYHPLKKQFLAIERRWPVLYVAVSLAVSAFMLTSLTVPAWETLLRNAMGLFDNMFIWLVRYFASPAIDEVMIAISDLGFGISYIIIVVAAFSLLTYLKRWREVGALAICLVGGAALSLLLKHLFQRSRPDLFRVVPETGYSFPSGHAMASMCFFGMAAFLIMRIIPSWRWRLTVMTLAVILIVAIGISRIYLGVHYPTDVVAGYAAGSMWLAFCISLLLWWEWQSN